MTKQKALDIYNTLNTLGELKGTRFAYGVSKNVNKLQPEINALQKSFAASEEFLAYDKERVELAKEYSHKIKGEPVIIEGRYDIEDQDKFDKELEKLQKKHKKAVEEREKQFKEFQEILKEEVEIDLYKIKISDVPQEITARQMNGILEIIEE